jgi:hypothetical protein
MKLKQPIQMANSMKGEKRNFAVKCVMPSAGDRNSSALAVVHNVAIKQHPIN